MTKPPVARRAVHGVLLLDKPLGWSSNQAVQAVKRLYRAERAGHTGTLDPLASGLLPICLGEATKFSAGLLDADKAYRADVELGVRTTTGDAEGAVLARSSVDVSDAALEAAIGAFRGEIAQVPPMYSALKRDGKPLYEYARAGVEVARAARRVTIRDLRIEHRVGTRTRLYVRCSKGTYIRSLADDLGAALGCGAHLAALRRLSVGALESTQAVTPAELDHLSEAARDALLLPMDALLSNLPAARLDDAEAARFALGQPAVAAVVVGPGPVRVYGPAGGFLGLGRAAACGKVHPVRLLRAPPGLLAARSLAKAPD